MLDLFASPIYHLIIKQVMLIHQIIETPIGLANFIWNEIINQELKSTNNCTHVRKTSIENTCNIFRHLPFVFNGLYDSDYGTYVSEHLLVTDLLLLRFNFVQSEMICGLFPCQLNRWSERFGLFTDVLAWERLRLCVDVMEGKFLSNA